MQRSGKLKGIFTPNIVPLDAQGEIHEPELRRYVDWLIDHGVHGLYPNGSTGEFTRFTPEERRRIIEIMADQTAGRVPILAGAAEANVKETIQACEYYYELGVAAVAIVSPFYYRLTSDGVYAYFKEIADHSPIDITLYNIPMFASPIDVPTVRRLAEECPKVVAIKDSSGDLPHMMRMIAEVRLYDLTVEGKIDEARDLQYRLLPLFDTMLYSAEFPEGFRAAMRIRGFHPGQGRQPQSEVQQLALEKLTHQIQCLLANEGYSGEPSGGCGIEPKVDPEQVAKIVRQVMGQLEQRG